MLAAQGLLDIAPNRLEYRMAGPRPDAAPTLILLHEGLGSAGMWGDFPDRLAAVTGFGVIRIGEDMLEAVGALPLRWGENNVATLAYIAGGLSVPVVASFSVWFYRKALNAERILTDHEAKAHAQAK